MEYASWMRDAACVNADPELFFPTIKRSGEQTPEEREAKSVCSNCPVTDDCLQFGLEYGEGHGIYGGLNDRERRKMGSNALRSAS